MDAPLINGKRFAYSSIKIKYNGKDRIGVKSIDYDDELDRGEMRGTGSELYGTCEGDYKASGSITFYKKEFDLMLADLGNGFYQIAFNIVVVRQAEPGDGFSKDELIGCWLKKSSSNNQSGSDPSEVKCDILITVIKRNDLLPIANMRI